MNGAFRQLKAGLVGVAAAFSVLAAPAANATLINGIVDVWNVNVNAIFDIDEDGLGPDTSSVKWDALEPNGMVVNNKLIQWGTPTPSSLSIGDSPSNVNINTNGAAVANISVTHANNPINAPSGELDSVKIVSTLTLTPSDPAAGGLPAAPLTFTILFDETPNADIPCIAGGANNQGVNINGCADVFVIDKDSLNFEFSYQLPGKQNQKYFISFFELTNALTPLSLGACTTTGATWPCKGFLTPEQAITTFQFAARITTEPLQIEVPEPGTLASLSVGLLALGAMRRRRRA